MKKQQTSLTRSIPLTPTVPVREALATLEQSVGGRERLILELSHSPALDEDEGLLMRMLADPANDDRQLAAIAAQLGFTVGGVLRLLSKARGAAALVRSMDAIYRAVPQVAEDLMQEATSRRFQCQECNGVGQILPPADSEELPKPCKACWGTGEVVLHPDIEVRKTALQVAGVLKTEKAAGVNVQVNNISSGQVRTSAELREATDRVLYGSGSRGYGVVEAEVVETGKETADGHGDAAERAEGGPVSEADGGADGGG